MMIPKEKIHPNKFLSHWFHWFYKSMGRWFFSTCSW